MAVLGVQAAGAAEPLGFAAMLEDATQQRRDNPAVAERMEPMLQRARELTAEPIIERHPVWAEPKGPQAVQVIDPCAAAAFASATNDSARSRDLVDRLPLLAAAYRITGDETLLAPIIAQLTEIATWNPLQRPGWTMYKPESTLPSADYYDGVWLATGGCIQALVLTVDILGPETLPEQLRTSIDGLLQREIERIVTDWQAATPWYVKARNYGTNQWVAPTLGLILACLYLGPEDHQDAYELGVANMIKSVQSFGTEGAVYEGFGYATALTIPSIQLAARCMAVRDDRRVIDMPFLQRFPLWLTQHYQPGDIVINCFDTWLGNRGLNNPYVLDKITMIATLADDPHLNYVLAEVHGQVSNDFFGLLWTGTAEDRQLCEPPLYASYEIARRVNWRSSWASNASGLWVRGWHPKDFHAHHDYGHVNFIVDGKMVLIEAGTPGYSVPEIKREYQSLRGHNVLQVGDAIEGIVRQNAPIEIARLDEAGGDVTVKLAACYEAIEHWNRRVVWDAEQVTVYDDIQLVPDREEVLTLRWHLGSALPAELVRRGNGAEIHVHPGVDIFPQWIEFKEDYRDLLWQGTPQEAVETAEIYGHIESQQNIDVAQEPMLDHVFKFRVFKHEHACIVVQTAEPTNLWQVQSHFTTNGQ